MTPRQGTAAVAASIALLAGCGGGSGDERAAPSTVTVEIRDFMYDAAEARVAAGGSVTFVNRDRADHTATTTEGAAGEFDTVRLETGDSAEVRASKPGSYAYVCTFHPYMKGTVVVEDR